MSWAHACKKFLRQIQHISSNSSMGCREDNLYVYHLPFRFTIPHKLISARSDVHPDFLKLCPSAKIGSRLMGPMSRKIYRQPIITYVIRIIRVQTGVVMKSPIRCQDEREILIMPWTPATPPLEIKHFPQEYKPFTSKCVKQQVWKRFLGHLHVSAVEPVPLNICTPAPRASTVVSVQLTFTPKPPPCEIEVCPQEWKCVVKYYLRSRTFYSTRKLERMPTSLTTKTDPLLRMREEKNKWEVREFGLSCWGRGGPPQDGNLVQDESLRPWTTTLLLPINASKTLLPTFLNALSARQYALVLRLMIEGLHHATIELIVPTQVIYYPADADLPAQEAELETSDWDSDLSSMSRLLIQSMILRDDNDLDSAREQSFSPPPYDCI
jgi:hypothetical protein